MTTALQVCKGLASRPGRSLPPGKTRYPLYRSLGGSQDRSGQMRKNSPPPGFDPWTTQPVASRYTDYATRPTLLRQGAIISTYYINRLAPLVAAQFVLHKVRAISLYITWLRMLAAGHLPRRPSFDSRSVYVTFVVNKVVLGQDFLRALRFPRVIFVDILLLPEGRKGEAWKTL